MNKLMRNYLPEIESLLSSLISAGFKLRAVDNGDNLSPDGWEYGKGQADFARLLEQTDDSKLLVESPHGRNLVLWIVLGNDPGEMVSDSHSDPELDKVIEAHEEKWEGQRQPMKGFRRNGRLD
jgi:hypothetical protein